MDDLDGIDKLARQAQISRMTTSRPQGEHFISAADAAAKLDVSVNTVKRRVEAGILRGYQDPTNSYYSVAEGSVDDLLEVREALKRSAALPGARPPRKEWAKRPTRSRR